MKLFVGLGNPGSKYARNRHNVGFMAADAIASEHGLGAWRQRFQGVVAEGRIGDERCLVLKPETYMNESGRSVGAAVRYLKIAPEDVIVLYDEIDLAPGKLKVKTGGGNAGHNGLRSLSAHIDNNYVRVRIGVGHPGRKDAVARYVLHDFSRAEEAWLEPMLAAIAQNAAYLAAGDNARFLSAVAVQTQEDGASARVTPAETAPAAASARTGRQRPPQRSAGGAEAKASRSRPTQSDLARQSARPADTRPKPKRVSMDAEGNGGAHKGATANPTGDEAGGSVLAAKLRSWLRRRSGE